MNILTPVKAIRAKCIDCAGNQRSEVKLCCLFDCSLWPYRMGVRPNHPKAVEANKEALANIVGCSPPVLDINPVDDHLVTLRVQIPKHGG